MFNPFKKRASEYIQDEAAFLATVAPDPLFTFIKPHVKAGDIFDRLVAIRGTPGSGKTTIASLFRFRTISAVLKSSRIESYRELQQALSACGAIKNSEPAIAACRIPMEAEYRDYWELPYSPEVKSKLLFMMLQARAVLLWLRDITAEGIDISAIDVRKTEASHAAAIEAAADTAQNLRQRAEEVEREIYRATAALIPPSLESLGALLEDPYRPFDILTHFSIMRVEKRIDLLPLVILDDAHTLHRDQLRALMEWLRRRELGIGRWLMTRIDALDVDAALMPPREANDMPGTNRSREITEIWLQQSLRRNGKKSDFRVMAKNMSARYIRSMPLFLRRNVQDLESLLETAPHPIAQQNLEQLVRLNDRYVEANGIGQKTYNEFKSQVENYAQSAVSEDVGTDVQAQMTKILLARFVGRRQRGLFDDIEDEVPEKSPKASSAVANGARLQLMHSYGRPYYYGIDAVSDAAAENAEQFLRLSSALVDLLEQRLISNQNLSPLDAVRQHRALRDAGDKIVSDWNFPQHTAVRRVVQQMADACLERSLKANAPLGAGAIGFGIPQDEYELIPRLQPRLAEVLRYAIAYNACSVMVDKQVKKRVWSIIELGGAAQLKYGLTLQKGGFIESTAQEMSRLLDLEGAE